MVPASQSTPTLTPAAASLALLAFSVTSRTRIQRTPAVCLTANMANAECRAWAKHTASVTVDIQERRATEVRKTWMHVWTLGVSVYTVILAFFYNLYQMLFKLLNPERASFNRTSSKLLLCSLLPVNSHSQSLSSVCVSNSVQCLCINTSNPVAFSTQHLLSLLLIPHGGLLR